LFPSINEASPYEHHEILGPDEDGHGANWTIGLHDNDTESAGAMYRVSLSMMDRYPLRVSWERMT